MKNKIVRFEFFGVVFILCMSVFLQNLFQFTNRSLLGIMFGAVNNSIWEIAKTVFLPYVIWSMLELLSIKCVFRRFVAARTISICVLAVSYISICLLSSISGFDSTPVTAYAAAVVCSAFSLYLSHKLVNGQYKIEILFYPAIFVLLLLLAIFFSFTTFPPQMYIFMDRTTGLYGIIPQNFDYGAVALDVFYELK